MCCFSLGGRGGLRGGGAGTLLYDAVSNKHHFDFPRRVIKYWSNLPRCRKTAAGEGFTVAQELRTLIHLQPQMCIYSRTPGQRPGTGPSHAGGEEGKGSRGVFLISTWNPPGKEFSDMMQLKCDNYYEFSAWYSARSLFLDIRIKKKNNKKKSLKRQTSVTYIFSYN